MIIIISFLLCTFRDRSYIVSLYFNKILRWTKYNEKMTIAEALEYFIVNNKDIGSVHREKGQRNIFEIYSI